MRSGLKAMALGAMLAVSAAPAASAISQKGNLAPQQVLTEESRGVVRARVGVPIEIQLWSQPGTGYSWAPTARTAFVTELKPKKSQRSMPGSWQTQRFQFLATKPGSYRVSFAYQQPWKGGAKDGKTKNFVILVR